MTQTTANPIEPQEGGRYVRHPDGTLETIHQTAPAKTRAERLAADAAADSTETTAPGTAEQE